MRVTAVWASDFEGHGTWRAKRENVLAERGLDRKERNVVWNAAMPRRNEDVLVNQS